MYSGLAVNYECKIVNMHCLLNDCKLAYFAMAVNCECNMAYFV